MKFIIFAVSDEGPEFDHYLCWSHPNSGTGWSAHRSQAKTFDTLQKAMAVFERAQFFHWLLKIEVIDVDSD